MDVDHFISLLQKKDVDTELTLEAVQTVSARFAKEIWNDWTRLRTLVEKYEAVIRKRWTRKSLTKRKEFLLRLWPDMPALHRPDFSFSIQGHDVTSTIKDRSSILWPYINIEDLSDAKSLLIFINARSQWHPEVFAPSELDFCVVVPSTDVTLFPKARIILRNGTRKAFEESAYGLVEEIGSMEDGKYLEDYGIAVGLIRGFQILRTQHGIYRFLFICCEQLLTPDFLENESKFAAHAVQRGLPNLLGYEEICSTFADAAKKVPYLARKAPNISRLAHLVSVAFITTRDHHLALREDPTYFSEIFHTFRDHPGERILNAFGQPLEKTLESEGRITDILRYMLLETYIPLIYWDVVRQQFSKLTKLSLEHTPGLRTIRGMPQDYFWTLITAYRILQHQVDFMMEIARFFILAEPPFQMSCVRRTTQNPDGIVTHQTGYDPGKIEDIGRVMLMLLHPMCKGEPDEFRLHRLLDSLETYCSREPTARQWLSPLFERFLTPLSIMVECMVHLKIHLPGNRFNSLDDDVESAVFAPLLQSLSSWESLIENDFADLDFPTLGDPSDGKFEYPTGIEHTKANVEARRKAEANLDKYWKAIDKVLKKQIGAKQHKIIRRMLDEGGPIRRTAPWVEVLDPEQSRSKDLAFEYHPFSEISHDSSKEITGNFNRLSIANEAKTKTRGKAARQDNATPNPAPQPQQTHKPLYHVDKDSYNVFTMLFHTPNDGELPGKVRWDQVVAALTKLGFSAEKLHGSAWQFTPRKIKLARGIQFHEPHPDGEVSLRLARRYGRRLTRTYGWDETMFKQK